MQNNNRMTIIIGVLVVLLSAAVGFLVPLGAGSGGRRAMLATATALAAMLHTPTPTPTSTPVATRRLIQPPASATTISPTHTPSATPSPRPTATPTRVQPPTVTPTLLPTATPTATPSPVPVPTEAAAPAIEATPSLEVIVNSLRVRAGPGTDFPVIGAARLGDTFAVVGVNETKNWWQICCIGARKGWLYGQFVQLQGDYENVPVISSEEVQ
ncbi:MAG TPA: hypothetical protein EYP04_09005 [Anaerolineae bacterium]|nr:hypothetical protein [Anaerolineae bacterium]